MSTIGEDGLIETHVIPKKRLTQLYKNLSKQRQFVPPFPKQTQPLNDEILPFEFTKGDEKYIKEHIIASVITHSAIPDFLRLEPSDIPHLQKRYGYQRLQVKMRDICNRLSGTPCLASVHKQTATEDMIDQIDMTWNLSRELTKAMKKRNRLTSTIYHFLLIFQNLHPHLSMKMAAATMVHLLEEGHARINIKRFVFPALEYSGPTWETVMTNNLSPLTKDTERTGRSDFSRAEKRKLAEALLKLHRCKYPQREEDIIGIVERLIEETKRKYTPVQLIREMVCMLGKVDQIKSVVRMSVRLQMSLYFLLAIETRISHQQEKARRRELDTRGREVMRMIKERSSAGILEEDMSLNVS
ncbi:hypothetical protein B0I72DRAFT_171227 [Yarrowia lipolytica]|uniref:YALI0A21395p n=1 Tax=Yarrowia lipolytica (strain CLIB 122 / E 150) TaxID=284591 RepID=Q6CG82_YARLI|nr:YALI0A21395p [Yarrowia lipolytica CLIB122]RDW29423.1 hypothetical protein B0I72DRAFT_171227 [Yarrowia lipolytica]CAG84268.2 YALI0A21395p [Yarrowia lipolytica CLIB122]|eukprot:XP_500330.2 YALI0A21395p [Yarrowia lipolytica CLIB122]